MVPPLPRYNGALRLLDALPGRCPLRSLPGTAIFGGGVEISQVPEEPLARCRALGPRSSRADLAFAVIPMLPAAALKAPASAKSEISRLDHTAASLAVYASQDESPRRHARLASGLLARLWPTAFAARAPLASFRMTRCPPSSRVRLRLTQQRRSLRPWSLTWSLTLTATATATATWPWSAGGIHPSGTCQ